MEHSLETTVNRDWLIHVSNLIVCNHVFNLQPHDVTRLREIAQQLAAPTGISETSLESIPVGARLTTECPTCKRQVLSQDIEPFADKCKDCRIAELERQVEAAKVLRERMRPELHAFCTSYVASYNAVADFDRDFAADAAALTHNKTHGDE